jgi:DNA-binding NarL/FixJ family response regulator
MGIDAFAARAERELLATGERVRKRLLETREHLTAQELQVARLARDGLSNPDIAARCSCARARSNTTSTRSSRSSRSTRVESSRVQR